MLSPLTDIDIMSRGLSAALYLVANGNIRLCLYGAFGATLLYRSILARRDHRDDIAREDAVIGLFHIVLAFLDR